MKQVKIVIEKHADISREDFLSSYERA